MVEIATKDLLVELNELREELGLKPLKSWKESRAKLEDRIDELDEQVQSKKSANKEAEPAPKAKKSAPKAPKKEKKTPPKAPKKASEDGFMSLADIARDLDRTPKTVRAKLRRHGLTSSDGRWPRIKKDSKEYKELVEIINKDVRPRAQGADKGTLE